MMSSVLPAVASLGVRGAVAGLLLGFVAHAAAEGSSFPAGRLAAGQGQEGAPVLRTGRFVYLPGMLATDEPGTSAADSRLQCERILQSAERLLRRAGSRLANVAAVTVYLRSQTDYRGMNDALRAAWPTDPPVRTTVMVGELREARARVAISMVGLVDGVERITITPSSWKLMPYSFGILSGDTLFLAGLVSRDPARGVNVPGDVKAQTRQALENGRAVLAAAGMTFEEVVSARLFLADLEMFGDVHTVLSPYFPAGVPPRATARTGFPSSQYLLEISLVAVRAASRRQFRLPGSDGVDAPNAIHLAAIDAGGRLFGAGITGATSGSGNDVRAQTRDVLARVERTLTAAGYAWSNLVEGVVFVRDLSLADVVASAYREVVGVDPPWPMVGTPIMEAGAQLEFQFTAAKSN